MAPDRFTVPFKSWHYAWLSSREAPAEGGALYGLTDATLAELERGTNWTVVADGEPLACGGVIQQWPGRHIAWMYLGKMTAPHMLWLTREVLATLSKITGRIEFTVREDFSEGHRWARMLQFEVETPKMLRYAPDGASHTGYVRFN